MEVMAYSRCTALAIHGPRRNKMWQFMSILELGSMRTCEYDYYQESPDIIVDDFYYDCEDDDLHDE